MNQKQILENASIEIVGNLFTIDNEIETRLATSRKLNRSIDNAGGTANYCGEVFKLPLNTLESMMKENDSYLQMLYDLKKEHSPFKNVVPKVSENFEAGAIVYDSWGWEQTNIDFYCIVKRSGQFVTLLPMKKHSYSENFALTMSMEETPTEIDFTAKPVRKKIAVFNGKESGFSLRDYACGGWVSLYEGQPKTSTHYA